MENSRKPLLIPQALVVADYSLLAHSLVKSLITKGCEVVIVSNDTNSWLSNYPSLSKNVRFSSSSQLPKEVFSYVVIVNLNQSRTPTFQYDEITTYAREASKFVVINPIEILKDYELPNFDLSDPFPQLFFVAPVVSEDGEVDSDVLFSSRSQPVEVDKVTSHIERALFSFAEQKRVGIVGNIFNSPKTVELIQQSVDELITIPRPSLLDEKLTNYISIHNQIPKVNSPSRNIEIPQQEPISVPKAVPTSILSPLSLQGSKQSPQTIPVVTKRPKVKRPLFRLPPLKVTSRFSKRFAKYCYYSFFSIVILLFVFPLGLVTSNVIVLRIAKSQLTNGNYHVSSNLFSFSSSLSYLSQNYFQFLMRLPGTSIYSTPLKISSNLQRLSIIGDKGINIIMQTDVLIESIIDKESIDTDSLGRLISLEIDTLVTELGFLESSVSSSDSPDSRLVNYFISPQSLKTTRERLVLVQEFMEEASTLLGVTNPQQYILVLQDFSITRPTGGKITYLIAPTFSGGKLIDIDIFETEYIDRQFKGSAEIPYELATYFDQSKWSVADAGYDLEFDVNAQNVIRFLDNSISITSNGVVGIDERALFEWSELPYESSVTAIENSIQKIIQSHLSLSLNKRAELYADVYRSLENGKLLVYLVNENLQNKLSELGYSGEFNTLTCTVNCYSDTVGLIENGESSISQNDISRKAKMNVSFEEGLIKREVVYEIKNSSVTKYSGTLNLITTRDAGFGLVTKDSSNQSSTIKPDVLAVGNYKKAIVAMTLQPGETSRYTFTWESGSEIDFNSKGDYFLSIHKQPSISNYPFELDIRSDGTRPLFGIDHSLTNDGIFRYNTELDRDTELTITW